MPGGRVTELEAKLGEAAGRIEGLEKELAQVRHELDLRPRRQKRGVNSVIFRPKE